MARHLEAQRKAEQSYWDKTRVEQAEKITDQVLDPVYVQKHLLRPCYEGEGDSYSENRMLFHRIIARDGGWRGKYVLDYGCGLGNWAIYFALTRARKVAGFDIGLVGISKGMERVKALGLDSKVTLLVMDAANLSFPDNEFEIVIGTGVLHHTIKYPGIFENLFRVTTIRLFEGKAFVNP